MYLQETTEQRSLRTTLRDYFRALMTPEVIRALRNDGESGPARRRVLRQMGTDGMLGIGWPKEYGGQGRPATDQLIFFDEAQRAQAPLPFVTLNTVGPTLTEYGTDEQKQAYLPRILAGEIVFAIGYSEPAAGTDLASLATRAVRDGEQWGINGQKIFTSGADVRLFVVGLSHESRCEEASRAYRSHRAYCFGRIQLDADPDRGQPDHDDAYYDRSAGAGGQSRRR